jgi:23S rRNA (uracil1939-C5)-methyltransferase
VQLQVGTDDRAALAVTAAGNDVVAPGGLPATIRGGRHTRTSGGRSGTPHVAYSVAGRVYRASATSFFQASTVAAEHVVDLVRRLCGADPGEHVLELYAGVGLLSAALAADGARVTAVEASAAACRDARANVAGLDVTVLRTNAGPDVGLAGPVDAVVLDPPRQGAGSAVMTWVAGLAPTRVVYVSCDPATFARDARVLCDRGFALSEVIGVDQFTHTGQVELVAAFRRDGAAAGVAT